MLSHFQKQQMMNNLNNITVRVCTMYSVKENLEELMSNHNLTLTQLSAELSIPYKTIMAIILI